MRRAEVICGDCRTALAEIPSESVSSIVTDPPYGLGREPKPDELLRFMAGEDINLTGHDFMGKNWQVPPLSVWRECYRVLKPGGHMVVFAGDRTMELFAMALRLVGFHRRHTAAWIYSTGFPKSLDVSKAIDKHLGAERPVVGHAENWGRTAPATAPATAWDGWGTALKPAFEAIILVRKPFDGSVAENVLAFGTGAINVDACRIEGAKPDTTRGAGGAHGALHPIAAQGRIEDDGRGRWPPTVLFGHDCPDGECVPGCPVRELEEQSGEGVSVPRVGGEGESVDNYGDGWGFRRAAGGYSDEGTAARFFPVFRYTPKAARSERERGCSRLPARTGAETVGRQEGSAGLANPRAGAGRTAKAVHNTHACVKPLDLMRWLVRLVTPPGGLTLDPYCGSGSTGVAALEEGFDFIGIDQSAEYCRIARARIAAAQPHQLPLIPGAA